MGRTSFLDRRTVLAIPVLLALVPLLTPAIGAQASLDPPPQVPCLDPRGCPDLEVDATTMDPFIQVRTFSASNCAVVEGMVAPGTRELLRFTFTSPNFGAGDLIVGAPNPIWYEFSTCHMHHHFKEYADYRLWTPTGFADWDALRAANPGKTAAQVLAENPDVAAELVEGRKQGFCVIDLISYGPILSNPPKYLTCAGQGISRNWADEYHSSLDGQWVDITGLPSGSYVLESEVNAEWLFEESDYTNNRAHVDVTI